MGETIVYLPGDGKLVIWDEESPDGWMVLDPDVIMADNVEDDIELTGPQTTREGWLSDLDDWSPPDEDFDWR